MTVSISASNVERLVSKSHYQRLLWANENAGKIVPWKELAKEEFRICTVVEGIYKPKWTEYSLSTKQLLESPYADKLPIAASNGSWTYEYFQKGLRPEDMNKFAQNRGLLKCMEDGVPVIVCIQQTQKPKPVTYLVQGIGIVQRWTEDGYFHIHGVSFDKISVGSEGKYSHELEISDQSTADYDPTSEEDGREKTFRAISDRRGQPKFRKDLIDAYEGKCAFTQTGLECVLEAAHITKYNGEKSNVVSNGLLLRADIHTLWDLGLLGLTTEFRIITHESLEGSIYAELEGRLISLPKDSSKWPALNCIKHHRQLYDI